MIIHILGEENSKNLLRAGNPRMIDRCEFGSIVIDGKEYASDLIIYPDGHVDEPWRRKAGHRLSSDDIDNLIESEPEVIIAGTGVSGLMKPDRELEKLLHQKGIKFLPAPNMKAMELYNELCASKKVGACFHLTC
jgi:hypothetical protein